MANTESSNNILPPRRPSLLAAVLSYLVPGLGQIYQGRVAKGILFLVCLYGLFFTGMALGDWKNVYLPDLARGADNDPPWDNNTWRLPKSLTFLANVYNRPHFAGQVWIGVAAWPAIAQYLAGTPYVVMPDGTHGRIFDKEDPAAPNTHHYVRIPRSGRFQPPPVPITKLSGDEVEVDLSDGKATRLPVHSLPLLGRFMEQPDEDELNQFLTNSDKTPDLGWVYTVIAGVLNILVIYDAFAGPAFGSGAIVPREVSRPAQEVVAS
jgi:hypothetical protein